MSQLVSKTLVRDARKHLKSNMTGGGDVAYIPRLDIYVPVLVVVQRWAVPLKGIMSERTRVRKWNLLMPSSDPGNNPDAVWGGQRLQEGDRAIVPGHGTFMVLEVTDPNTFNIATSVWTILTNASVTFSRPIDASATVGPVDVFIQRVTDEMKQMGVAYDWEVWYDASIVYPDNVKHGSLISQSDEMEWVRSPNPFPNSGNAVLEKPKYVYGQNGDPIVTAYFKEPV